MEPHQVAIVMDPDLGDALRSLASQMHVWIIGTPGNRAIAQSLWAENPNYSLEAGVTTFDPTGYLNHERLFEGILDAVDEHHGEMAHDPPWTVLHVHGIELTERVRSALAEYGAVQVRSNETYFTATREPPASMMFEKD